MGSQFKIFTNSDFQKDTPTFLNIFSLKILVYKNQNYVNVYE
jgi:hypothetical protein